MEGRSETLAALRRSMAGSENGLAAARVPLGHDEADAMLGGLRLGALHEVYAGDASQGAAASGFAAALALRLGRSKALCWIGTDFAALEYGALHGSGLLELGLNPKRLVLVRLAKGDDALRAASDVLACNAIGAVVLEIAGQLKALDLTASRRLSLAAGQGGTSPILLRFGALPQASACETRWLIRAAPSPPVEGDADWGLPRFDAQLLRNRHGTLGRWIMEWDGDNGFFRQPGQRQLTPHHGGMVSAVADRPVTAEERLRRTG